MRELVVANVLGGLQMAQRPADGITHPGWGATFKSVQSLYLEAERGSPRRLYECYDDIANRDCSLLVAAERRADWLAGSDVVILPGGSDAASQAAAERFQARWSDLPTQRLIAHHAFATLFYGFAATEIVWVFENGEYIPRRFIHPRNKHFRIAVRHGAHQPPDAELDELLVQTGPYYYQCARLIPGKWIVSRRRGWTKPLAHQALMYTSVPYAIMKSHGGFDWFSFLKRFGLPFAEARIHNWTDALAHQAADDILKNLGKTNGVKTSTSDKIELKLHDAVAASRAGTSDVHDRFVRFANAELSKLWTGGTLTGDTGDGGSSYALGKEHGNSAYQLVRGDATRLAASLRHQLIEPWMRLNSIPGKTPRAKFYIARIEHPALVPGIAKTLADAGVDYNHDQVRELVGLSAGKEQDREAA